MDQESAKASFRRMMIWIVALAVLLMVGSVWYLTLGDDPVSPHMIAAAIIGVLLTVFIGGGLMATVFFSSNSGLDETAGEDPINHADEPHR